MATKPTKITDWATDGAALIEPLTTAREELGWQTTPDNLVSQPGERPNLQQQNYWQLAVHEWSSYLEEVTDENVTAIGALQTLTVPTLQVVDLWEWDVDDLTEFNVGTNDQLRFTNDSSQSGSSTDWVAGNEAECDFLGYFYEFIENFNRGVGIQLIDNNDDLYQIMPVAGSVGHWVTNEIALSGRTGINSIDAQIKIQLDVSSAKMEVYKNGVLSDFSTFDNSFANRAAIDAKNPNGFRAIMRVIPELNFSYNKFTLNPLVRRRYRIMTALRGNRWNVAVNAFYPFTLRWDEGTTYRINYNWIIDINGGCGIRVYAQDSVTTDATLIDYFALVGSAASWDNQQNKETVYTEAAFSRTIYYTARNDGNGLTKLNIELNGFSTPRLVHNANAEFNSYSNLNQMSILPMAMNSIVMVEG